MSNKSMINRRDFLKLSAAALGATLYACQNKEELVNISATIVPPPKSLIPPTLNPGEFADTILYNGNLLTIDAQKPTAQAIAIKNGLILQVSDDSAIKALAGANTQQIDLQGKTVTPGMIDAHNHLQVWGNMLQNFLPLIPPDVKTHDELLTKLKEAVPNFAPGAWIQGYFWYIDPIPNRYELDAIAPENPIWLLQRGGHFGVTNSMGLKIADITAKTKDPEGGIIERDDKGEPTGLLYNHRAMDLLRAYAPQPTIEDYLNSLYSSEELMAAVGVTTYHDCNARFDAMQAYMQAGQQHSTLLRSEVFYTLEWPADLDRALYQIPYYSDEFIRFAGYKFLIDGQFPTWYTHESHPGICWNMPTWDKRQFAKTIKTLHDTGLQISVHCGGDAAVDLTLDAYERAMDANPRSDPRHRIEHASLTKPESTQKAADLGVIISSQPQFVAFSANVESQLGKERTARLVVVREWLDAGIRLALGSDTPSSPWYEPQITLTGAVGRFGPDGTPFHPEQRITIQEALYAHTIGSAIAAFEENVKGSLTPGKYADLVVWSDNFYTADPKNFGNINADLTMVAGKIIHQAEPTTS